MIDPKNPRLTVADLSENEFVGELVVSGSASAFDSLDGLATEVPWNNWPEHPLLQPIPGYSLRYTRPRESRAVALIYDSQIVGIFIERDVLVIDQDHRGKGLGRELVLAAFAQNPWKDIKARLVTEAGAKTLHSAWQLAKKVAKRPSA